MLPSANSAPRRPVRHPAHRLRHLAVALLGAVAGCTASVTEPAGATPLDGRWDIAGQIAGGSGGALQGALTIQSSSAASFTGAIDLVETNPQGQQRRVAGPLGGRMATATTAEFDVVIGGATRRHIATLLADTLRGSWFEISATGGLEVSGTFRAVRKR